jgi:hypothetical protein
MQDNNIAQMLQIWIWVESHGNQLPSEVIEQELLGLCQRVANPIPESFSFIYTPPPI